MSGEGWLYHGIQAVIIIGVVAALAWSVKAWRDMDRHR